MADEDTTTKTCTGCKLPKPLLDFRKCRKSPDGINWKCLKCEKEWQSGWLARCATLTFHPIKQCTKCGLSKPREEFHVKRASPDGLDYRCMVCNNAINVARTRANPESNRRRAKAHYYANQAEACAASRLWRLNNLDRYKARKRETYAKNAEKNRRAAIAYYWANRDRMRASFRSWRERNYEHAIALSAAWRVRRRKNGGAFTKDDIHRIFALQKGRCAGPNCRRRLVRRGAGKMHIDHIMPLFLGGSNNARNLQLLCRPCNQSKHAKHPIDWARGIGFLI